MYASAMVLHLLQEATSEWRAPGGFQLELEIKTSRSSFIEEHPVNTNGQAVNGQRHLPTENMPTCSSATISVPPYFVLTCITTTNQLTFCSKLM